MSQREQDLDLLRALLSAELTDDERSAFEDMLWPLEANRNGTLSTKQRAWARSRAEQLEIDIGDPAERNRNVPRGKEVKPMWSAELPKRRWWPDESGHYPNDRRGLPSVR